MPTFQAVETDLARQHCRVDHNDEDGLIAEYIEAATEYAESHQNRCLRTSTWEAVYDGFWGCDLYLPNPRLQSVSSITYLDENSASQTVATSVYLTDAISEPGRISLKPSQVWPATADRIATVTVTFVAGYQSAAEIPASTKQAIRILACHWYLIRAPIVTGTIVASVPHSVNELLDGKMMVGYR